jgi:preprotein translocase subunit YajC
MFATPAYAQTAGGASAAGGITAMVLQMAPLVMIFIIFWFLMIRPQQLKAKQHRAMIDAAKKGDSVVTGGGLIGKVTKVDGDTVEIEIAAGVKVKAVKSTLADITPWSTGKPAND